MCILVFESKTTNCCHLLKQSTSNTLDKQLVSKHFPIKYFTTVGAEWRRRLSLSKQVNHTGTASYKDTTEIKSPQSTDVANSYSSTRCAPTRIPMTQ